MLSSSYLQKSRSGVFFARFIVPAAQRAPTGERNKLLNPVYAQQQRHMWKPLSKYAETVVASIQPCLLSLRASN